MEKVFINWSDTQYLLAKGCVNTILCDDPHIRTAFTRNTVFQTLESGKSIVYIDLDTMFTISLEYEGLQTPHLDNLVITNPDDGNIDRVIAEVSSLENPQLGLVVFDSVTTFYHIFPSKVDYGELNRRLGIYLFLLKKLAIGLKTPILIVSLLRAKKTSSKRSWVYSYSGGRVLERMSDVILTLSRTDDLVEIKSLKHRNKILEGKAFIIPLKSLNGEYE